MKKFLCICLYFLVLSGVAFAQATDAFPELDRWGYIFPKTVPDRDGQPRLYKDGYPYQMFSMALATLKDKLDQMFTENPYSRIEVENIQDLGTNAESRQLVYYNVRGMPGNDHIPLQFDYVIEYDRKIHKVHLWFAPTNIRGQRLKQSGRASNQGIWLKVTTHLEGFQRP